MNTRHFRPAAISLAVLAGAGVQAHVTLEQAQAPAGSSYKAVLRVGHGCNGTPTHTLKVIVPDGMRGVKPMPKPGWSITITRAAGGEAAEISWAANNREAWLDDAHYDEFVLRGQLPAQAGPMWFKLRQICAEGQNDWSEVPASGTSTRGLKSPAALLEIVPATGAAATHQH
jgi:uncharacterized protein YcnI